MATDKIHSHEPFLKGEFSILKDSSYKAGETFLTISTFELIIPIGTSIDMYGATMRANNDFPPALFSNEITATFIVVKVTNKRDKRIKMCKFQFHSSRYCIYLYLDNGSFLQKNPGFLSWISIIYLRFSVNRYIVAIIFSFGTTCRCNCSSADSGWNPARSAPDAVRTQFPSG